MIDSPFLFLHVDVDSPRLILKFWQQEEGREDDVHRDVFYRTAMPRALDFFKELDVPATFFCVGEDLVQSSSAAQAVTQAFAAGHEIANHSFSHLFGFSALPEEKRKDEILKCSEVIQKLTGKPPAGFRAPGFHINQSLLLQLETLGFRYDSSLFLTTLNRIMSLYHKFLSRKKRRRLLSERTAFG